MLHDAGDAGPAGDAGETGDTGTLAGPARIASAAQVFVDDLELLVVREADAHHLADVLRLRPGETVVAADGRGAWRPCAYRGRPGPARAGGPALLEATGPVEVVPEPVRPVTVGFVPVKGERPEWVVQKLTELGVDRVVVLRSARGVVRWDGDRAGRSLERLGRVAREAAAQSRRARIPSLQGPWSLGELASALVPEPWGLADPGGPPLTAGTWSLAVGPEGGWDDAERAAPGAVPVGLGPAVLRAETAAVAAGTLLCALRDGSVRAS